MAGAFEVALRKAEKELAECNAQAIELERRRALLRQTIVVLKSQLGIKIEKEGSMTDAIVLVLQGWDGAATVDDVVNRLAMMGFEPHKPSVATLLSRLASRPATNIQSWFADGEIGYEWAREMSKAQRLAARKELAERSPNKKPIVISPKG